MKKYFISLTLLVTMVLFSCSSDFGKKVKINDRLEVYIKDGATEEDAKKLGTYIDTTWKENRNMISFQLLKDSGNYTVKMVVDQEKVKQDSTLDASFIAIKYLLEQDVFTGNKVKLVLTDDHFKDLKSF